MMSSFLYLLGGKLLIFAVLPLIFDKIRGRYLTWCRFIKYLCQCRKLRKKYSSIYQPPISNHGRASWEIQQARHWNWICGGSAGARRKVKCSEVQIVLMSPENAIESPTYRNMLIINLRFMHLLNVSFKGDQLRRAFAAFEQLRRGCTCCGINCYNN